MLQSGSFQSLPLLEKDYPLLSMYFFSSLWKELFVPVNYHIIFALIR